MRRLKTIFVFDNIILFMLLLIFIYSLLITKIPHYKSIYDSNENNFVCKIDEIEIDGDKLSLDLKCKERLVGTYYFKTEKEKDYFSNNLKLGSKIKINGNLNLPKNNTVPNLFNYKKYLYNKRIYFTLNIDTIAILDENMNIFYKIKNGIYKRTKKIENNEYIYAYVLGKTNKIDDDILNNYRKNGISHLFALSGLHVSIFSLILLKMFKAFKLKDIYSYILVFLFLLLFSFITNFSPSILRSSMLFVLLGIKKVFNIKVKNISLLYLVFIIMVLINPFIIYNISFILSFSSTYFIIKYSDYINDNNYIKSLFKVSLLSFVSNMGLSIYLFGYINPLGVLLNILFVPFISFIVFPLTLFTFLIPKLSLLLKIVIFILEKFASFDILNKSVIYFPKINLIIVILFYIILIVFLNTKNKKIFLVDILIIVACKVYPIFDNNTYIYFIDVNQGDSILIVTPYLKKTILIDTGGKTSYNDEAWKSRNKEYSIGKDTLIPFMRSLGIKKLDYMFLTHGDYDHMGEAINLVENFKVEKVIFNCGVYNTLEDKLIKVLEREKINYFSCLKELNIDNNQVYFLNTKEYDNENDNSSVIYTEINNYKFLFMGDASKVTEKEILNKYNLPIIDVLKVGHHGSKTSSGEEFISAISPKYSIISVGKNNRYHHPNKEVLDNLNNSKIYRTDQDGSIMFKIKNSKLEIETCTP